MIYHFHPKKKETDKFEKLVCNLYDKKNYVIHIQALKQALDYGLIQELNSTEQLSSTRKKPYIDRYLTDDDHVDKKAKGTKKCVIKPETKFQDYK